MRVEILELKLSSDGYSGTQGDRLTIPDEIGMKWCAAGWAKDLAGVVATGDRMVIKAVLEPAGAVVNPTSQEV